MRRSDANDAQTIPHAARRSGCNPDWPQRSREPHAPSRPTRRGADKSVDCRRRPGWCCRITDVVRDPSRKSPRTWGIRLRRNVLVSGTRPCRVWMSLRSCNPYSVCSRRQCRSCDISASRLRKKSRLSLKMRFLRPKINKVHVKETEGTTHSLSLIIWY